jgi:hypothetical protein
MPSGYRLDGPQGIGLINPDTGNPVGHSHFLSVPCWMSENMLVLTNQPSTEQFLANHERHVKKLELGLYTHARLAAWVGVGSASVNSPRLLMKYRTTFSASIADYSNIGTSEISISMASAGILITSAWTPLVTAAQADVFIAASQIGGNGTADPSVNHVLFQFKRDLST